MSASARLAKLERAREDHEDPAIWAHVERMWRIFPEITHPDDVTDQERWIYRELFGEEWPTREPRFGERRGRRSAGR